MSHDGISNDFDEDASDTDEDMILLLILAYYLVNKRCKRRRKATLVPKRLFENCIVHILPTFYR